MGLTILVLLLAATQASRLLVAVVDARGSKIHGRGGQAANGGKAQGPTPAARYCDMAEAYRSEDAPLGGATLTSASMHRRTSARGY